MRDSARATRLPVLSHQILIFVDDKRTCAGQVMFIKVFDHRSRRQTGLRKQHSFYLDW